MAIRDHLQQVTKQRVRIVTVDPTNERRVEGIGKDGAVIQIAVYDVDNLFRWPKVGEFWTVRRENGPWYLESKTQDANAEKRIEDITAGDYLIDGTVNDDLYVGPNVIVRHGLKIPASAGAGKVLTSDASGNATWGTKTIRAGHTWMIRGALAIASGDTDFIPPFFFSLVTGQTAVLAKCRYKINSGTSATVKLQKNGVDITGFTGISVTTTVAETDPADVALANNDSLALVVTAVSGTPTNMSLTLFIDSTI